MIATKKKDGGKKMAEKRKQHRKTKTAERQQNGEGQ